MNISYSKLEIIKDLEFLVQNKMLEITEVVKNRYDKLKKAISFENYSQSILNTYYYFNPNKDLVSITKEELQTKFDDGIFEYVREIDPIIPGIETKVGVKK